MTACGRHARLLAFALAVSFGLLASACSRDAGEEANEVPRVGSADSGPMDGVEGARQDPVAETDRPSTDRPSEGSTDPRAPLTPAYLEGEWCGVLGGKERSRHIFAADGSYRAAVPGYVQEAQGTVEALLDRFPVVVEVEADRFVLTRGQRGGHALVFHRGPC